MNERSGKINLLIVDDEDIIRNEINNFFKDKNYIIYEAGKPSIALDIIKKNHIDIIILDIRLPEMDGLEVLQIIKKDYPAIEVIMITAHGDTITLHKALEYGAFDFFYKPISLLDVKNSIEKTNKFIELSKELKNLKENYNLISRDYQKNIGNIIGKSKLIKDVIALTNKAAASPDTSVLITGESGCGKELIAKVLHYTSIRAEAPFYPVNCSAIPETLIESEFFGHIKGSFTGAVDDQKGAFEAANGGTVFLDEIGDMPLKAQAKLLRVLEERKVKRIGSKKEIPINVRIIAATNMDLNDMVRDKRFRSDLLYRLNTIEIMIPSLRERREDIPVLIDFFVKEYSHKLNKKIDKIDDEVYELLSHYGFPGNVRELANMIERSVIICDGTVLSTCYFSLYKNKESDCHEGFNIQNMTNLDLKFIDTIEKQFVVEALKRAGNNKSKAAILLNISRFALDRRIEKYTL